MLHRLAVRSGLAAAIYLVAQAGVRRLRLAHHTHMQVSTLALAICFYCFGARTSSACANCVVCRLTTLVASAEVDDDARWDSAEEAASMASAIVSRALGQASALGASTHAAPSVHVGL